MTSFDHQNYTSREIDLEIANLEARIISLKSIRNALAPISRLHPEVLQEIFNITQVSSQHKGITALLLTWISHSWRELAHQTSDLWTYIDFHREEWVSTTLSRAGGRTMDIKLCATRPFLSTIELCLGNMYRIRRLNISHVHQFEMTFRGWSNPAPHLVELNLCGVTLPVNLFSGTYPSLRSLILRSCQFDWDMFPLGLNLKHLSIASPRITIAIDKMMKILREIALGVNTLEIDFVLESSPISTRNLLPLSDRVPLNHLHTLRINEYESTSISVLLNNISIPQLPDAATIVLNAAAEELNWPEVAQALTAARGLSRWEINDLKLSMTQVVFTTFGVKVGKPDEDVGGLAPTPPTDVLFLAVRQPTSDFFEYFGFETTVRNLVCEPEFVSHFIRLLGAQLLQLSRIPPAKGVPPSDSTRGNLDESGINLARSFVTFKDLRSLELQNPISDFERDVIRVWLTWREKVGLPRFEKVIVTTMLDESPERVVEEIEVSEFLW